MDAMPSETTLTTCREALLAGDPRSAAEGLARLVARNPADTEARYWLASALAASGRGEDAGRALEDARTLHGLLAAQRMGVDTRRLGNDGDYAARAARELYAAHHVAMAGVLFGRAIAAGHLSQDALLAFGLALQHQGRAEEAIRVFRAALETYPSAAVHQFMLFPHFHVENGPARYAAEARAWALRWAPEAAAPIFANTPSAGRKLRIGYVAPSFCGTQVRQFITPILESHDPGAVEVTLYPAKAESESGWPSHIAVRGIGHLPDAEAAASIRAEGIDLLVDCWGHSAGSRLAMFAHRPAPVQVAWINFVQTTGLGCMDYVLHSDSMAAPGTEALFTEKVRSMGPITIPYRPLANRPPPWPAPALARGQVTFGAFSHPARLSDATIRAWGRILRGAPTARLVLKYRYFVDPVLQRATQARFAAERVAPERIEFRTESAGAEYLAAFSEIDLALDPSPCPGGTTTCDALAMGVPVLTLAGADFYARIGLQCLIAAGLPKLITESWDAYVAKAVALAEDAPGLAALRARVRPGIDNGPFTDEVGFTRKLEAVFREMFDERQAMPAAA